MQRTTIKDIAAAAGVSHTTVSYVLNKNPNQKISDKTRRKVIETARKWWRPLASLRRQVVERHGRNASRLPFSYLYLLRICLLAITVWISPVPPEIRVILKSR